MNCETGDKSKNFENFPNAKFITTFEIVYVDGFLCSALINICDLGVRIWQAVRAGPYPQRI